jgi:hypothetical protein
MRLRPFYYLQFKHPTIQDNNHGELFFNLPVLNDETGKYEITLYGTDTENRAIAEMILSDDEEELSVSDRLNPTKVFWWVVSKIKGILCPSCM